MKYYNNYDIMVIDTKSNFRDVEIDNEYTITDEYGTEYINLDKEMNSCSDYIEEATLGLNGEQLERVASAIQTIGYDALWKQVEDKVKENAYLKQILPFVEQAEITLAVSEIINTL